MYDIQEKMNNNKMNKFLYIVSVILLFTSCDQKEDSMPEQSNLFPQTWKLVQMSGNMQNSTTFGADMEWQEEYNLRFGNSFTKRRTQNGETKAISGLFIIEILDGTRQITFTYPSESELIGSCTGINEEQWIFQSETVAVGTWQQCDGPGLVYNLIK